MSYLGPGSFKWWLQPSLRKRKRVETEEAVDSDSESQSETESEGESEAGSEGSEGESAIESESEDEEMEGMFLVDVPPWIILGRKSHQDGTDWTCGDCLHFNPASQHLFVNLPAFKCGRRDAKRRIDFRFSFGNLAANGLCPIGKVLNQGNTDDCLVFALAKAAEITDRILSILLGSPYVVPTLDPYSLKETYARSRVAEGIERRKINFQDEEAMERMMELMQTNGVQDVARNYTSRIGGFEEVSRNFEDIATELAKGFPLVVDILPGRSFFDLMYGEIYKCPYNDRTKPAGLTMPIHTVVLVGAARVGPDDYFYFLNSYGESWCFRVQRHTLKEIGGVGKLTASDICNAPFKFWRM